MLWLCVCAYVFLYLSISIIEFEAWTRYKNISCLMNITILDNFTNLTDGVNEDDMILRLISMFPNYWFLTNSIVGLIAVFLVIFVVINKNKGENNNFILSSFATVMMICRLLLISYAVVLYSILGKTCFELEEIYFGEFLTAYYCVSIIEIIFVFAFLGMKSKEKKMHNIDDKLKPNHNIDSDLNNFPKNQTANTHDKNYDHDLEML
jgi:hypothetical protein